MIVNETKTKVVLYGNITSENVKLFFNGKFLETVNQYKYLGILFNSIKHVRGNVFREACKTIGTKATRAMFKIKKDMKCVGMTPPSVTLKLLIHWFYQYLSMALKLYSVVRKLLHSKESTLNS